MNPVSPVIVRELISRYGFRIKKSLGQNFLIDGNIIKKIVDAVEPGLGDTIVEIGPGLGALTRSLAAKAGQVIAVEIDQNLIPVLQETLAGLDNVRIVESDALKTDLDSLVKGISPTTVGDILRPSSIGDILEPHFNRGHSSTQKKYPKSEVCPRSYLAEVCPRSFKYKVAANLPYYITSPLIMHLLENHTSINRIVVMVQEEVARRLTAQPDTPEYGALTVAANFYARTEMVFRVPRTVFMPRPEVDSAVVRLEVREVPAVPVRDKEVFFKLMRAAFQQRRKTLLNAVGGTDKRLSREIWLGVFQQAGIDPGRRGETLSLGEFARLAEAYTSARADLQ